mgnify:CR=1 FL=1
MEEQTPPVSVIIVNYDSGDKSRECVKSHVEDGYGSLEVVVIDNGSIDGSVERLEAEVREHPNIRLVQSPSNIGFAKGNNVGALHAR